MTSNLKKAVIEGESKKIKARVDNLSVEGNWSLVSIMEELTPLMLMESNLKYGNFHMIKMSLFLRENVIQGYFSRETEKELVKLLTLNLSQRPFIEIEAQTISGRTAENPVENMLEEIDKGNVHNAYYYALNLLEKNPAKLGDILLNTGTRFIPDSLGHTFSCFYPVVRDYIYQDSEHTATALLSYIMYLSRYDLTQEEKTKIKESLQKKTDAKTPADYSNLTYRCTSGQGIVNLHHMITLSLFVLSEKEKVGFTPDNYKTLTEWIGEKKVDQTLKEKMEDLPSEIDVKLPSSYKEFKNYFRLENLDQNFFKYLYLLKKSPETAVDWMFRLYTEYYNPEEGWDPHYFTGLYAAFNLYFSSKNIEDTARKMSVYQALKYFADGIL